MGVRGLGGERGVVVVEEKTVWFMTVAFKTFSVQVYFATEVASH